MDQITPTVSAQRSMMEQACKYVLLLGYAPEECRIEHHDVRGELLSAREVLIVANDPVFEIVTTSERTSPVSWAVTVTPNILGWPPSRNDGGAAYYFAVDRINRAPASAPVSMIGKSQ